MVALDKRYAEDEVYMNQALCLAKEAGGAAAPNPMVGAVLVKDGQVIGQGWHVRAGEDHAEVMALKEAQKHGQRGGQGATIYVTLEPCNHYGKTPPCAKTLVEAGVKRVVIGTLDPNVEIAGGGKETLESSGVEVTVGVLEDQCKDLIAPFAKHIQTGLPLVTAKWAMTLDGQIATDTGDSRWVSSPESRQAAHYLRHQVGAMLVGTGTMLADNPTLTARPEGPGVLEIVHQPLRVFLDARGNVPPTAHIFTKAGGQVIAVTSETCPKERRDQWQAAGAEVWIVEENHKGLEVDQVLVKLGQRGVNHVLCEGGGFLHGTMIERGLVDEVEIYLAPKVIGNAKGRAPVRNMNLSKMADAHGFVLKENKQIGPDLYLRFVPGERG